MPFPKAKVQMPEKPELHHPWLVAVWPGMGHVALNAGVYLLAKLGMNVIAEFEASDLFDIDHVEVKEGIIQAGRRPRNRFFVWKDPQRSTTCWSSSARPSRPSASTPSAARLIAHARELGVERVFTFAAMATQMHPEHRSRIFGAATDRGNPRRAETPRTGNPAGRPHRRSQRRAAGAAAEGGLRGLPAGRNAAPLQPAPLPESLPGHPRSICGHRGHRSRPHRTFRPGQGDGSAARRTPGPRGTGLRAATRPRKKKPTAQKLAEQERAARPTGSASRGCSSRPRRIGREPSS